MNTKNIGPTGSSVYTGSTDDTQVISYKDTAENAKEIFIIGIPDYILSAINSKGVDTDTFLNKLNDILVSNGKFGCNEVMFSYLNNYLTKYDIQDVFSFNSILADNLELREIKWEMTNDSYLNEAEKVAQRESINRIINHYNDNDLDLGSILMSKINSNDKLPFEIKSTENCLFVLPKRGFTNFITKNIQNFKPYFLNFIIITLRKLYGEKVAYNSLAFRIFSRLVYSNTR